MNGVELQRTDQQIRALLMESKLRWVLDEVDQAIAMGVPEERVLRRRAGRRRAEQDLDLAAADRYETVSLGVIKTAEREASRQAGTLVTTTRPMTIQERVELLFEALRRVLTEVPEIEKETLKTLFATPGGDVGQRGAVMSVSFVPSEDSQMRPVHEVILSDYRLSAEQHDRLITLFHQALAEVRG